MFRPNHEVSEKCIGCYPKIEQGLQTQCTEMCIGKIRGQGFLEQDNIREDNPIDYLVRVRKIALPLYPQYGTLPNVYYIPPIHVPPDYLVQMFGPGVEAAQKAYRGAKDDVQLAGLLHLFGSSPRIMERFAVANGVARGFDAKNALVAETPLVEPPVIREAHDQKLGVHRLDVT
jgi:nitrate reductase beta subunit